MRKSKLTTHWITHCWNAAKRIAERDPERGRALCEAMADIERSERDRDRQQQARESRQRRWGRGR